MTCMECQHKKEDHIIRGEPGNSFCKTCFVDIEKKSDEIFHMFVDTLSYIEQQAKKRLPEWMLWEPTDKDREKTR